MPLKTNRRNPAAELVRSFLHDMGMDIEYRPDLNVPYAADDTTGRIWLPEGLDWRDEHARIDRCWLYLIGGVQVAPEFSRGIGNVVPLLRRPW